MSAVPRDRHHEQVGSFIRNDECGPEYLIDALASDESLCKLVGQLIQCGEGRDIDAQIGAAIRAAACAYQPLLDAIERNDRIEQSQHQRDLFDAANADDEGNYFPSWERFTNYDKETGIACSGEI